MKTKPDVALGDIALLEYNEQPSKRIKIDEIGNISSAKLTKMDLSKESKLSVSDLQRQLADIREKYTIAIEKLLHKRSKLEIKELNRQCQNMTVKCTLTVPDFNVPPKVESPCIDSARLEELKRQVIKQMDVVDTLNKMKNCPIAQAMLKL